MKALRPNTFRVIGGTHRGRRFAFPGDESVRPSPDRVRETLFNWLQPVIAGARCLDLFCGSGALGLEAISRGAAFVEFVDQSPRVIRAVREHLTTLREETKSRAQACEALSYLHTPPPQPFDVVFLDPPYAAGLLGPAMDGLEQPGWLKAGTRIYLESAAQSGLPLLPDRWRLLREGRAGQVGYYLAVRD